MQTWTLGVKRLGRDIATAQPNKDYKRSIDFVILSAFRYSMDS